MPHNSSTVKRLKQSKVRRLRNRSAKSEIRTYVKQFLDAIKNKDKDKADAAMQTVTKLMDTAAGKGTYHKNTVARKKSRLKKQLNNLEV